jgi:hypothetical protein
LDFQSTLPQGRPDLVRASAFRRYVDDAATGRLGGSSLRSRPAPSAGLTPSLWQDLQRFEADGGAAELLDIVAAALRHAHALTIHVQAEAHALPLSLYPRAHVFGCPLPLAEVLALPLRALQVIHVEPAATPPGGRTLYPLPPLTWALALRGAREALLPEIAGPLAYRVRAGVSLEDLGLGPVARAAVRELQRRPVNLERLSGFAGLNPSRAQRLLNALYLHGALIVSRSHPAASDGWLGGG